MTKHTQTHKKAHTATAVAEEPSTSSGSATTNMEGANADADADADANANIDTTATQELLAATKCEPLTACVFGSSSNNTSQAFMDQSHEMGRLLALRGHGIGKCVKCVSSKSSVVFMLCSCCVLVCCVCM